MRRYEGGERVDRRSSGSAHEREIMAMALYNGKVYVGSLPMANVWRMDAERFRFLATLDSAPAPLRRVWAMAVYQGRLFAGRCLPGAYAPWKPGPWQRGTTPSPRAGATWPRCATRGPCGSTWTAWRSPRRARPARRRST